MYIHPPDVLHPPHPSDLSPGSEASGLFDEKASRAREKIVNIRRKKNLLRVGMDGQN